MTERRPYPIGTAPLAVVTRYSEKDSYLMGALHHRKGWYWWHSATSPEGHALVGVMKGPFDTEAAALDDSGVKIPFLSAPLDEADRELIIQCMADEIRDSAVDMAKENAYDEPLAELLGYCCPDSSAMVDLLNQYIKQYEPETCPITGEFLRLHDDEDGYPELIDWAKRMGLITQDELSITDLAREFVSRFS